MATVPSVLRAEKTQCCVNIDDVLATYGDDLPIPTTFPKEFQVWKRKWRDIPNSELPNTPSMALTHADTQMFPNVNCLLRIMCTLPVTSCECERSVSVLRRLKTYMRTTMGEERLTGLALLHTKYNMPLDLAAIIDIFAGQHPRRMTLNLQ